MTRTRRQLPTVTPAGSPPGSGTYPRTPLPRVLTHVDVDGVVLTQRAREVDPRDPAVVTLARSLVATMRVSPACVGLAAPQIGASMRVFCMDVSGHRKRRSCAGLVVIANPVIVARSGNVVMREGCMSVPHLTGDVARAAEVTVEGIEPGTSRVVRVDADAIEARCLQHEIDHLDGYVFVERVLDPTAELFPRKRYA
jgi:peptide deformylase